MLSDQITVFIIFSIAIAAGFILCIFFMRSPLTLFFLALTLFISDVIFGQWALRIQIGPFSIFMKDVLSIFLLATASIRIILTKKRPNLITLLIIVLGIFLFVSWFRGNRVFGLELSTNAFREYLYFFSALFFTISLKYSQRVLDVFASWLGWVGWILIAIAIVRWTLVGLGMASSTNWLAPGGMMTRVIFAAPTLFLLQLLILHWYDQLQNWNMPLKNLMPYIFLPAILILQQRTIWVALAFIAILVLALEGKIRGVFFIGLVSIALVSIFIIEWGNFSSTALSGTALDLKDFNWRLLSWQALISPERYQSYNDFFIGQPFGTGYTRALVGFGSDITVSPHNFYVESFLNIGGLGLVTLLSTYLLLLTKLWGSRTHQLSRGFIALLAAQLIFYITYSPNYEQGFILGIAILFSIENSKQAKIMPNNLIAHTNILNRNTPIVM